MATYPAALERARVALRLEVLRNVFDLSHMAVMQIDKPLAP